MVLYAVPGSMMACLQTAQKEGKPKSNLTLTDTSNSEKKETGHFSLLRVEGRTFPHLLKCPYITDRMIKS